MAGENPNGHELKKRSTNKGPKSKLAAGSVEHEEPKSKLHHSKGPKKKGSKKSY